MAGILNKKERILDFKFTDIGQKLFFVDGLRPSLVSFSDVQGQYYNNIFTEVPIFEMSTNIGSIVSSNGEEHSFVDNLGISFASTSSCGDISYYDARTNSSQNITSSNFVISSFKRRLEWQKNLTDDYESEKGKKNYFVVIVDQNTFNIAKNNSLSVVEIKQMEPFYKMDAFENFYNFQFLPPQGITGEYINILHKLPQISVGVTDYAMKKFKSFGTSVFPANKALKPIGNVDNISDSPVNSIVNISIVNNSKDGNCVLQVFEHDKEDYAWRLDLVQISSNEYLAGKFIYEGDGSNYEMEDNYSMDDLIDLFYDTNPQINGDGGKIRFLRAFPFYSAGAKWSGDRIKFASYFKLILGI